MERIIVDLTYTIEEGMTTYPSLYHPVVEISQLGRLGIEGRESRKVVLGSHTGTHVDAPRHFIDGGASVDELDLRDLTGPARRIDMRDFGPGQAVDAEDLELRLPSDGETRVVLWFGWTEYWGSKEFYTDHPYLTRAAARLLLERDIRLLGMDTPMPDNPSEGHGSEEDSPLHKLLLGEGVVLLEYLCDLDKLGREQFELYALPLKLNEGDGAPVRCVGIVR